MRHAIAKCKPRRVEVLHVPEFAVFEFVTHVWRLPRLNKDFLVFYVVNFLEMVGSTAMHVVSGIRTLAMLWKQIPVIAINDENRTNQCKEQFTQSQ